MTSTRPLLALSLLALAAGCGPGGPPTLEGFGETAFESGDGDGDGPEPPNPGDGDGDEPPSGDCIDADFGSQFEVFFGDLFDPDRPENHASLCGEDTPGPDYSMQWRAPITATYRAELFSELPSVLAVREDSCDGPGIGCELAGFPSVVEFQAFEGQRYVFVADTLFDDLSFFDFALYPLDEPPQPGSCPDAILPSSAPLTINGSTSGAPNNFGSPCGGENAPERTFLYTAPATGLYRIDTLGSDYDTMLYVLDGECDGGSLECNDDFVDLLSAVDVFLDAGQTYTIVVDGFGANSGNFELNVSLVEGQDSLCDPIEDLGSELPTFAIWPGTETFAPVFGECADLSFERRHRWVAPVTGLYSALLGAQVGEVSLAVSPSGCEGLGMSCSGVGDVGEVLFDAIEGQEIVFVSEWANAGGELGLSIELLGGPDPEPGCGESLGQGLPVAVSGSTNGGGNQHNGSCSVNGAPEVEFHWVPSASGNYKISLEGSNYDTLLYVRRGDCDGQEIACNDDTFVDDTWFLWSSVDIDVQQGETISIFVDGYNGSGAFDLSITQN